MEKHRIYVVVVRRHDDDDDVLRWLLHVVVPSSRGAYQHRLH